MDLGFLNDLGASHLLSLRVLGDDSLHVREQAVAEFVVVIIYFSFLQRGETDAGKMKPNLL